MKVNLEFEKTHKAKEEAFLKVQQEEAKKGRDKAEKEVEKRSSDYDKALDSMPGGWDLLGMKVVEGLATAVVDTVSMFTTRRKSPCSEASGGVRSPQSEIPEDPEVSSIHDVCVYNNMKQHAQQIQHGLETFFISSIHSQT